MVALASEEAARALLDAGLGMTSSKHSSPSWPQTLTVFFGLAWAVSLPAAPRFLNGRVRFRGRLPEARRQTKNEEPAPATGCGWKDPPPLFEVDEARGLAGVVLRVPTESNGQEGSTLPTSKAPSPEVVLDQIGCQFRPSILVARPGQTVVLRNSDQVFHNVNAFSRPGNYARFNRGIRPKSEDRLELRNKEEVLVLGCDAGHPWMRGYLLVTQSPWVTVSSSKGSFRLPLPESPPGSLDVFHPVLGWKSLPFQADEASLDLIVELHPRPGLRRARAQEDLEVSAFKPKAPKIPAPAPPAPPSAPEGPNLASSFLGLGLGLGLGALGWILSRQDAGTSKSEANQIGSSP